MTQACCVAGLRERSFATGLATIVAVALHYSGPALGGVAGGRSADIRLFEPAVDSKGLITVDSSPVLPHLGVSFGFVLDYAKSVFALPEGSGLRQVNGPAIVDNAVWGTLHLNLGVRNWMALGLELPIGILGGKPLENADLSDPPDGVPETGSDIVGLASSRGYESQGLGNVVLHAKFRLLRVDLMPVGLAAIVRVGLPTVAGRDPAFMGDRFGNLTVTAVVDKLLGKRVRLSLNLGFRLSFTRLAGREIRLAEIPGGMSRFEYGHSLRWGAGVSFGLVPEILDLVVEIHGHVLTTHVDLLHAPMEGIAGLKVFIERRSYLYLGGGFGGPEGAPRGYAAPSWRLFAAFIFEPSIGDRDGDALKDDVDGCPDDPEDKDAFEDLDGCPDPDNDRDLILDAEDDCADVPEDRDGDSDLDGCPDAGAEDRDGDTILDTGDLCPDDPEDLDGFLDDEGCPDPDNDADDVLDVDDLCPDTPEDRDGFMDAEGCPDPDNDADRILDADDLCPEEPEYYNGHLDEDGCHDTGIVVPTEKELVILEQIHFETDSAEILAESHSLLDQVALTILHSPQFVRIQVAGHADERAANDYNVQLTFERATSVVNYLVTKGVPVDVLSAAGYGEECPRNPGHSEKAWAENRRVEFKILETTEGCTGAEIACDKAVALGLVPAEDEKYLPGAAHCTSPP